MGANYFDKVPRKAIYMGAQACARARVLVRVCVEFADGVLPDHACKNIPVMTILQASLRICLKGAVCIVTSICLFSISI